MIEAKCPHCKMDKAIRNPSGYCDHLNYPEYCDVCKEELLGKNGPCFKMITNDTELVPLDPISILNVLSNNQDYEQIPLATREKIAIKMSKTFGTPKPSVPSAEEIRDSLIMAGFIYSGIKVEEIDRVIQALLTSKSGGK